MVDRVDFDNRKMTSYSVDLLVIGVPPNDIPNNVATPEQLVRNRGVLVIFAYPVVLHKRWAKQKQVC